MELQDNVAMVTGGLGGIGRVISKRLLENGAKVVIVDVAGNTESLFHDFGGVPDEKILEFPDSSRPVRKREMRA